MLENANSRQHQILELLLENKGGLSIDELARSLSISRAAVQQHFVTLERDGFIKKKHLHKTAGRPVNIYELTGQGINFFPKQYAWFSEIILADLLDEISPERFVGYMQKLGDKMAGQFSSRMAGKNLDERVEALAKIMTELGYQVKTNTESTTSPRSLQATNCVYHDLAQKHQEICQFDLALMSSLLGRDVKQASCMAKGDCLCRFVVGDQADKR
jgi:predicted ArsR family transcriptional regulator